MNNRDDAIIDYYVDGGNSLRETASRFGLTVEGIRQILLREVPKKIRAPHDTRQHSSGVTHHARLTRHR